jgi:hypothetical protein
MMTRKPPSASSSVSELAKTLPVTNHTAMGATLIVEGG